MSALNVLQNQTSKTRRVGWGLNWIYNHIPEHPVVPFLTVCKIKRLPAALFPILVLHSYALHSPSVSSASSSSYYSLMDGTNCMTGLETPHLPITPSPEPPVDELIEVSWRMWDSIVYRLSALEGAYNTLSQNHKTFKA